MKIVYTIILLINISYIIYLDIKVHDLQDKLQQARKDAIKELNKLRKED